VLKDCLGCTRRHVCDETPMVIGKLPVQQCASGFAGRVSDPPILPNCISRRFVMGANGLATF
jgi:hypothetical protein